RDWSSDVCSSDLEGAAIVDAQDDLAPVVQVGDLHVAGQGQGLVGGGHAVQVVTFAVRGELVVELGAVPGGDAGFPVVARIADRIVALAHHRVGIGLDPPV